jgi:dTDP-4-dehydrorhamnose 3,5-epimerase-like enzyme
MKKKRCKQIWVTPEFSNNFQALAKSRGKTTIALSEEFATKLKKDIKQNEKKKFSFFE